MPQINISPRLNAGVGAPSPTGINLHRPSTGYMITDMMTDAICQHYFLSKVIQESYSVGHLAHPALVTTEIMDNMAGRIPKFGKMEVHTNIGELESVAMVHPELDYVDVKMTKDVIKFAISDEMQQMQAQFAPLDIMLGQEMQAFQYALDKRIMDVMAQNPMRINVTGMASDPKKFLKDTIPRARRLFSRLNLAPTALAINDATYSQLFAYLNESYTGLSTYQDDQIPGLRNMEIVISNMVPTNKVYLVSNDAPGIMVLNKAQVEPRTVDDADLGAWVFRTDFYRQVVGNLRQHINRAGEVCNSGIIEITTDLPDLDSDNDAFDAVAPSTPPVSCMNDIMPEKRNRGGAR